MSVLDLSRLPLSRMQDSYVSYQLNLEKSGQIDTLKRYMCGCTFTDVSGHFDADALEKAYYEVLRRNDIFRTVVVKEDKKLFQHFVDVEEMNRPARKVLPDKDAMQVYADTFPVPLHPVLNHQLTSAEIIECKDGNGGILIWQNHICTDGWTLGQIVTDQICEFYTTFKNKEELKPAKRVFSYAKVLENEVNTTVKKRIKDFFWNWKLYTHHFHKYSIPYRHCHYDDEFVIHSFVIDRWDDMIAAAEKQNCSSTSAIVLLCGIVANALLGIRRFSPAVFSHGRSTFALKQTAGPILSTYPLFFEYVKNKTVAESLNEQHSQFIRQLAHIPPGYLVENYCYYYLYNALHCSFELPHDWLCINNMMNYTSKNDLPLNTHFIEKPEPFPVYGVRIIGEDDGVHLSFQYPKDFLTEAQVSIIQHKFTVALDFMLDHPDSTMEEWSQYVKNA